MATVQEVWDACMGMSWPWENCTSGADAARLQWWLDRKDIGASLRVCAKVCAAIGRYKRIANPLAEFGVGVAIGQSRL